MNLNAYQEAKQRHPNMLLLFRSADFFELYGEDAETAVKLLGLTLTSRSMQGQKVPMAGFPHHALEKSLQVLLRAGQRVAICDQVERSTVSQNEPTLFDDMTDA